jgi:TorA maturation chaperone TorD
MSDYEPEQGAARETFCRLLAACYYQPAAEFAEERVFDTMRGAAIRIDPQLAAAAQRLGDGFVAENLEPLLVDYTRLFLGPVNALAKPYGSVWLSGEASLMQNSTMDVLGRYREGGFELAEDFRNLPDHIAAELEFLYLLIFRENEAHRLADLDALAATEALRKRFLADHLGSWVDRFATAMKDGAETDHYRALADLTQRFVAMEAKRALDA